MSIAIIIACMEQKSSHKNINKTFNVLFEPLWKTNLLYAKSIKVFPSWIGRQYLCEKYVCINQQQCNLYWSFRPCQKSKKNAQMKKRQHKLSWLKGWKLQERKNLAIKTNVKMMWNYELSFEQTKSQIELKIKAVPHFRMYPKHFWIRKVTSCSYQINTKVAYQWKGKVNSRWNHSIWALNILFYRYYSPPIKHNKCNLLWPNLN